MAMLDTITQVRLPDGNVVDIVDWSDLPLYSSVDMQSGFVDEEVELFQYVVGREVPGYGNPNSANPVIKRTATELDTNIATPGQMTTNEEMLVYAIKPEYFLFTTAETNNFTSRSILALGEDGSEPLGFPAASPEALAVFGQQMLLRFKITEKIFAEAGLAYFNTGFGAYQQTTINSPAASAFVGTATAGLPAQQAVRSMVVPTHIGAQEKFRVTLANPTGEAVNFGVTEELGEEGGPRVTRDDVMCTVRVNFDGLYKRPTA